LSSDKTGALERNVPWNWFGLRRGTREAVFVIIGIVVVIGAIVSGYTMEHGNLTALLQQAEMVFIGGAAAGAGIRSEQATKVRGFANQRLRKKDDPLDASNGRISLIVQYLDKATGAADEKSAREAAKEGARPAEGEQEKEGAKAAGGEPPKEPARMRSKEFSASRPEAAAEEAERILRRRSQRFVQTTRVES